MQLSTFFLALLFTLFAVAFSRPNRGLGLAKPSSCDEVTCSGDTQCVEKKVGFGRKARVRAICVLPSLVPDPSCDDLDCGNSTCVVQKRGRALEAVCVEPAATSCDDLDCGNDTCIVRNKGGNPRAVCVPEERANCFNCIQECIQLKTQGLERLRQLKVRIARCVQRCDCN